MPGTPPEIGSVPGAPGWACQYDVVTFVLVHGGGFSGSCWDAMIPLLDGPALAIDLPGRGENPADLATVSITQFVTGVTDVIVGNDLRNVILVGHSMAGLTLPGVAERVPSRLARLVFVSCVVPPHGKPLADVLGDLSPTVRSVADRIGDQLVDSRGALHPDFARAMFCNDMDDAQAAYTLDRMVPEAVGVLGEPVDLTGLTQPIPRTYVSLTQDASIDIAAQQAMIANLGEVDVIELDAGHMAMISRPAELARILNHERLKGETPTTAQR